MLSKAQKENCHPLWQKKNTKKQRRDRKEKKNQE